MYYNKDKATLKDVIKTGKVGQIYNVKIHTTPSGTTLREAEPDTTNKDYGYEYIGQSIGA